MLVRREQNRRIKMGLQEKTKFSFEFKEMDWLNMLTLLPDALSELDEEIAH